MAGTAIVDAIRINDLTKVYGAGPRGVRAVDGLSLTVPQGGVFGLLGPNGSGKTTVLRCLLGLVAPTSGRCLVFGEEVPRRLGTVAGRVGALLETSGVFPGFTARRNLQLLFSVRHGWRGSRDAADRCLEEVGLAARADVRVERLSHGMRQRVAIAAALLKDPELLVLDEPTNGLDPQGFRDLRQLLRALADRGRTVVVSSHVLREMETVCDRVAILSRGRAVVEGETARLVRELGDANVYAEVDPAFAGRAVKALQKAGFSAVLEGTTVVVSQTDDAVGVNQALAKAEVFPSALGVHGDLESVFLRTVEREAGDGSVADR